MPETAGAEPLHSGLSLQGFTGVLNTPNAQVTEEGWLAAHYTNQDEPSWRGKVPFQDNYFFSIGFFNFIEIGGRFTEAPRRARDLSGNLKLSTAALTRDLPLVPVLGVGLQDLAGGASFFRSRYLVLSEEIWRLRLSAGYGFGPDRMKGGFAGGEFRLHDWVYLLGEYDTRETNLGARVVLPQFWKVPVRFTATAKTSLDYRPGNFDFAVGFELPLDFQMRRPVKAAAPSASPVPAPGAPLERVRGGELDAGKAPAGAAPAPSPATANAPAAPPVSAPAASPAAGVPAAAAAPEERLARLRDNLASAGFLNVRVGSSDRTLVVEYENTIFNHNELDALGLVAGLACRHGEGLFDTVRIVVKRRDIPVVLVTVPVAPLRSFLEGGGDAGVLRDSLTVSYDSRPARSARFMDGKANWGILDTSLILAPGLTTFLGTEYGAFDYLLSLRPELSTQLWKGALLAARWDIPVAWSDNLEDGRPYRSSRHSAWIDRLMLFQAFTPIPSVMVNLGAGMVLHERYGVLNEAVWNPGDGQHRFRVVQGWDENGKTHKQSNFLLGSYRYYFSPLDVSLEGTGGRFYAEDEGFSFELKRFWRDTSVSVYYKDTRGVDRKWWRAVGVQFSFPLTPRRDMKPIAKLQVRGADEWSYAQETTLKNVNVLDSRGSLNFLAPYPLAINPQPSQALYRSFYNRDRLSSSYLLEHLDRLREAWLKYKESL